MAETAQSTLVGALVGNYRVMGKLGEGGMGAVFAAEHHAIGRKAAIKVLHAEMSVNATVVQRFFNEARATTLIRHPGIVDVFDFGTLPDGRAFIAMEFLDGESLASRIKNQGPMSLAEVAAIGRQAASALTAAHEKGIVHRDLKPDNIFLVPDADAPGGTRVKILDFGIAKLAVEGGDGAGLKTKTGVVMGTPVYMSPEQCKSAADVDARSDIYSLGCVLYEMACGQPPFVKEGLGEVLAAHIYEAPPPPRSIVSTVAPALEAALLRALEKRPDARTSTMAQLRAELDAAAGMRPSAESLAPAAPRIAHRDARTLVEGEAVPRPTTLGGAAGESLPLPARSRGPVAAWAVLGMAVLAVIGFVVLRQNPTGVTTTQPTTPALRSPSATVHLRIDSDPRGADVLDPQDGHVLGRTPLVQSVARAPGELSFTLRLAGYEDTSLNLETQSDGSGRAALRPLPATPSRPAPKTTTVRPTNDHPPTKPSPKKKTDVGLFDN